LSFWSTGKRAEEKKSKERICFAYLVQLNIVGRSFPERRYRRVRGGVRVAHVLDPYDPADATSNAAEADQDLINRLRATVDNHEATLRKGI